MKRIAAFILIAIVICLALSAPALADAPPGSLGPQYTAQWTGIGSQFNHPGTLTWSLSSTAPVHRASLMVAFTDGSWVAVPTSTPNRTYVYFTVHAPAPVSWATVTWYCPGYTNVHGVLRLIACR